MTLFIIYSKDNCSYCDKAKMWIEEFFSDNTRYYIEFKNPPQHVVDELKETTGQKTYPFIYCGKTFIGGYSELCDYNKTTQALKSEYFIEPEF